MLNITKLNESAMECLGWPYVSPGTNDQNGIDCSGLFVKMYRDQGARIYHGSNTIYHEYCSETGKLTSEKQLQTGMAIFKLKAWTESDKGNKWYGKDPGNLSHIGYVLSTNPLQIIHASSAAGEVTIDTKIGKWACWGKLKAVDYGTEPSPDPGPSPEPEPEPEPQKWMVVYAENGKPVNMRAKPNLKAALVDKLPVGTTVRWLKEDGAGWAYIQRANKLGWMLECFLVDEYTPTPDPDADDESAPDVPPETDNELTVYADNGKPVNFRTKPSLSGTLIDKVPINSIVTLVESQGEWSKIIYHGRKGYMMTKFLSRG